MRNMITMLLTFLFLTVLFGPVSVFSENETAPLSLPSYAKLNVDTVAVFAATGAQTLDGDHPEKADTVWLYYPDNTFDQYAEVDGEYRLFSKGSYAFTNNGDFLITEGEDEGSILINRTEKYASQEGRPVRYESSHEYPLGTLGFTQLFGPQDEGKQVLAIFGDTNREEYTDPNGITQYLDTIWCFFTDHSFRQYAILDGEIVLYSNGTYELGDRNSRLPFDKADHGTVTLRWSYSMDRDARLEKSYDLNAFGYDCFFELASGMDMELNDVTASVPENVEQTVSLQQGEDILPAPSGLEGLIDYTAVFPSWNPDSASLKELIDFVTDCTDESGPGYLPPADRIATFDMDGTILCEKAPVYVDYCLTMYRVLDDPAFNATEEERNAMQQIRDHAYSEGTTFKPEGLTKDDLVASAFAGMTPEAFRAYVVEFADTANVVGFDGMTYGQSFYRPMIEVINYLRANDFDIWMVSACEREVVRALVERFDIPYDHVIATDVPYVASGKGEEAADEYNMGQDETMLLGAPLDAVECGKSGKPAAIAREIGKRPVLAFGNSSGDYSMLNYAEGNPYHAGMGIFVVCDDTEREYGSDEKAAGFYEIVEKEGWTAFSMANDWLTIYGDDVVKTSLPGTKE